MSSRHRSAEPGLDGREAPWRAARRSSPASSTEAVTTSCSLRASRRRPRSGAPAASRSSRSPRVRAAAGDRLARPRRRAVTSSSSAAGIGSSSIHAGPGRRASTPATRSGTRPAARRDDRLGAEALAGRLEPQVGPRRPAHGEAQHAPTRLHAFDRLDRTGGLRIRGRRAGAPTQAATDVAPTRARTTRPAVGGRAARRSASRPTHVGWRRRSSTAASACQRPPSRRGRRPGQEHVGDGAVVQAPRRGDRHAPRVADAGP